jgi:predicted MFS family arabinose efflux permease
LHLILCFAVEAQVATAITVLGAWIGSLAGSAPSQKYGKRLTLLFNTTFFIVGAVLASLGNIETLFIGRFISGTICFIQLNCITFLRCSYFGLRGIL